MRDLDLHADHAVVAGGSVLAIGGWEMRPADYVRALQLLMEAVAGPVVGTVTAQNGSSTTCNGWVASVALGTLVIDAAGDGRAHPTSQMGSFSLAADPDHQTLQAAAGGKGPSGYPEVEAMLGKALAEYALA